MKSRGLTKRNLLVAAAAVAALAVYILFCEYSGAMPRCPFKWVTELDCPGCGSQRALHSLLHGHPMDAWGYNLILPPVVIYLMALVLLPLWGDRRADSRGPDIPGGNMEPAGCGDGLVGASQPPFYGRN